VVGRKSMETPYVLQYYCLIATVIGQKSRNLHLARVDEALNTGY